MSTASDYLSFSRIFRQEIYDAVEYSFSLDPKTHGTMVAVFGDVFLGHFREYARSLGYATEFIEIVRQFAAHVETDAYLFKTDWRLEAADRLSLYFRFMNGVPRSVLESAFANTLPLLWQGPNPHTIGEAIGTGDPVIVGLRVDKNRIYQSSVYFNYFETLNGQFKRQILAPLVQLLGWASDLSESVNEDVAALLCKNSHVAIGFDSAMVSRPLTLKISAADVSWEQVLASFSRTGVPLSRMAELATIARQLRQVRLNYAAMKFGCWLPKP